MLDPDALTVCIEHGAFVPCRKQGDHYTSQNPYWVKAVRDYQTSTIEGLTWEPASEHARRRMMEPGPCLRCEHEPATNSLLCTLCEQILTQQDKARRQNTAGIHATTCDHPRCSHAATTEAGELGGVRVCAEHVEWAS